MRRVEITEERLLDGRTAYHQGDVVSVDNDKAAEWIALGWARDPETGEQGERKPGVQQVTPAAVTQAQD